MAVDSRGAAARRAPTQGGRPLGRRGQLDRCRGLSARGDPHADAAASRQRLAWLAKACERRALSWVACAGLHDALTRTLAKCSRGAQRSRGVPSRDANPRVRRSHKRLPLR